MQQEEKEQEKRIFEPPTEAGKANHATTAVPANESVDEDPRSSIKESSNLTEIFDEDAMMQQSSNKVPIEASGVNGAAQTLVDDVVEISAIKETVSSHTKLHSPVATPAPLSVRSSTPPLQLAAAQSISLPVEQDTSMVMLLQLLQQQQAVNEQQRLEMQQLREEQRAAMEQQRLQAEQQRLALEAQAEQQRLQAEQQRLALEAQIALLTQLTQQDFMLSTSVQRASLGPATDDLLSCTNPSAPVSSAASMLDDRPADLGAPTGAVTIGSRAAAHAETATTDESRDDLLLKQAQRGNALIAQLTRELMQVKTKIGQVEGKIEEMHGDVHGERGLLNSLTHAMVELKVSTYRLLDPELIVPTGPGGGQSGPN